MTNFEDDITGCLNALKAGGVILYPTDTIWGLGCDATNESAVAKIFELKKRPAEKSMIVLLTEEKDVLKYVAATDLAVFDYLETQQRPTTVIYDNAIGLAGNLIAEDGSIAIRIIKDPFCRQLIKRFRKPLVSTSANFTGDPSPQVFSEINQSILHQVDYVVRHRQHDAERSQPSQLIRWQNGNPEIIRS